MRSKARKIALKIIEDQYESAHYSLEKEEYSNLTEIERDKISLEIYKLEEQFRKKYNQK